MKHPFLIDILLRNTCVNKKKSACTLSVYKRFILQKCLRQTRYQTMILKSALILTIFVFSEMSLTSVKVPKYLAIYYGWPSLVENSEGDVAKASNWFDKFDLIVFGDGIWKNTHGDNLKAIDIITNLIARGKQVFGYVDLGVSTQNLSVAEMSAAVDGWSTMGANVRI